MPKIRLKNITFHYGKNEPEFYLLDMYNTFINSTNGSIKSSVVDVYIPGKTIVVNIKESSDVLYNIHDLVRELEGYKYRLKIVLKLGSNVLLYQSEKGFSFNSISIDGFDDMYGFTHGMILANSLMDDNMKLALNHKYSSITLKTKVGEHPYTRFDLVIDYESYQKDSLESDIILRCDSEKMFKIMSLVAATIVQHSYINSDNTSISISYIMGKAIRNYYDIKLK